ncbi:hypothetical protein PPYR_11251 [Photinus pyralis]|uniref:Uncharacterized protein n=1 Tax=Photinus pyralis TaxID=7054 RepID=A0A5N4AAR1_PHOPY|nr:hypothetical protein PPYR_11251 [Photinus pyralis]
MQNYRASKVYTVSPINLFGVREQRRGLLVPEKPKFLKDIADLYSDQLALKYRYTSTYPEPSIAWLSREQHGSPLPLYKAKIVLEGKLPRDFDGIRSLKFSEDATQLIVGYGCGNIEIWPISSHKNKRYVKSNGDKFAITSIQRIPKTERFLAASLPGIVYNCGPMDDDYRIFIREPHNEINSVDVCYDGTLAATGGKDACIRLYDIETCKQASTVLTGSMQIGNGLQLWNINTGKLIECVSPLNRSVAVNGEFTYTAKFYDGDFSGNTVIAGGRNSKFEMIDIMERRVMCGFPVKRSCLAIDSKDKLLAFGGLEPMLRVVNYN